MPINRLKEFLDSQNIKYVRINHSPAYTAQEIAAMAHVRGKELAKTVMVKLDKKMAMAVLPASLKVSVERLQEASGANKPTWPARRNSKTCFPTAKSGPCRLLGICTAWRFMSRIGLAEDAEIAFNAGTHTELIRMAYKDFERLVKPKVANISFGS